MPGGMGVRVDTHIYSGYKIPSNYDSMIAKIIVNAKTRNEAISRMLGALDECVIEGIKTNPEGIIFIYSQFKSSGVY